jgi:hypothetical protein
MKLAKICVASIAATLFAGSAVANSDDLAQDIVYGSGDINSSSFQPYDRSDYDPRGIKEYIFDQADNVVPATPHVPYERMEAERDNSQDLIDLIS